MNAISSHFQAKKCRFIYIWKEFLTLTPTLISSNYTCITYSSVQYLFNYRSKTFVFLCMHACVFVHMCLHAWLHMWNEQTPTLVALSVCPMQTFCECVPSSSQLKHRWSDSEPARETPAKVRPYSYNVLYTCTGKCIHTFKHAFASCYIRMA